MGQNNIQIDGFEEIQLKLSRFTNFLGKEYNKVTAFKVAPYMKDKFREHIDTHKTKAGSGYSQTPDLEEKYKDIKEKRWGRVYPILRASDKMYNDITHKINTSWTHFASGNRIKLTFDFKTVRSKKIASYHVKGLRTKSGEKVRNPWFITRGEKTWIVRMYNKATKIALRRARLKTRGL